MQIKKMFLLVCVLLLAQFVFAQDKGGLKVTATSHSATLSWTQSTSSNIASNRVYRSNTSGGPYTLLFSSTAPVVTYVDTTVSPLTSYFYTVTAVCSTCSPAESNKSNEAVANIPGDSQPAPPTGLGVVSQ